MDDIFQYHYPTAQNSTALGDAKRDPDSLASWLQTEKATLTALSMLVHVSTQLLPAVKDQVKHYSKEAQGVLNMLVENYKFFQNLRGSRF